MPQPVFSRTIVVVLDSVGIGALPDAERYGDAGANTLGHLAARRGLALPHLASLGLGNIAPLATVPPTERPRAFFAKMAERSVGKDTLTGHWELMGLWVRRAFRTFPHGFPEELIRRFVEATGRNVLGNKVASGTAIIEELGEEHMRTGAWIVYTSADSVFQIAAHEGVVPLEDLYRACEVARRLTLEEPYLVGRVIARPFRGKPGGFVRTANRRDYAVEPFAPTLLDALRDAGWDVWAVGKIEDIFAGRGITRSWRTGSNEEGVEITLARLEEDFTGLLFVNLVDFDSRYGHRRDPEGYARALEAFDARVPDLLSRLRSGDLLVITADHGNDPYHVGTDHTREYVPLLAVVADRGEGRSLGVRETFADLAATLAENFHLGWRPEVGTSFLPELVR
ncbi:MAG: Phosphopentomutase [Brockia lithotrophica]|uniref:Phosphopentomutase n=1 Tax=Brockia lithotrophica TaxID=933949 RepID=A0A2T5G5Z7_9BACL|nr:phosphopentomutase [Brockia lithotrophica]PTQ51611.1 MAG: Phosphopentomutase [Brockia lithotrophica]